MSKAKNDGDEMRAHRPSRIPKFASVEEEAKFWDTHDFTEFWDESQPVNLRIAKNLSEGITIRLDPATTSQLRAEAAKKGIGPTTLVRMWVIERLGEPEGSRRSASTTKRGSVAASRVPSSTRRRAEIAPERKLLTRIATRPATAAHAATPRRRAATPATSSSPTNAHRQPRAR